MLAVVGVRTEKMENIQLYVRNTEEVSNNLKLDLVGRSPVLTRLIFWVTHYC